MFVGEAFETIALEAGFAAAEALPSSPDPSGLGGIGGLLARLQVGEAFAGQVMRLWPGYANRYLKLLNARDLSLGYLFWLTKSDQPRATLSTQPETRSRAVVTRREVTGGGMPLCWVLSLMAHATGVAGKGRRLVRCQSRRQIGSRDDRRRRLRCRCVAGRADVSRVERGWPLCGVEQPLLRRGQRAAVRRRRSDAVEYR
jgi:hypothetical protein